MPSSTLGLTAEGTFVAAGILSFGITETIVRCRGEITLEMDGPSIADKAMIAYGLAVVTTDAATVGASAMPDPAGEADFSWLYWRQVSLSAETVSDGMLRAFRDTVDTKAMRIVRPNYSLVWLFQYVDITGTPPIDIVIPQTRVLTLET